MIRTAVGAFSINSQRTRPWCFLTHWDDAFLAKKTALIGGITVSTVCVEAFHFSRLLAGLPWQLHPNIISRGEAWVALLYRWGFKTLCMKTGAVMGWIFHADLFAAGAPIHALFPPKVCYTDIFARVRHFSDLRCCSIRRVPIRCFLRTSISSKFLTALNFPARITDQRSQGRVVWHTLGYTLRSTMARWVQYILARRFPYIVWYSRKYFHKDTEVVYIVGKVELRTAILSAEFYGLFFCTHFSNPGGAASVSCE